VVGLAASVALDPPRWWVYVVCGAGAAIFIFLLILIWPGGMGPGDMKMALFMGTVLGASVVVGMFAAFLLGSLVGVYLVLVKKRSRKSKVPFGPFLAAGSVLAVFIGDRIIEAYLTLF
jgi:prepilin signal peptidase PulO-like enzyme (type II secretory pathway)